MQELTIHDIQELSEDVELEVKKATGRDGKGELPQSFFETYSAMANTNGGEIMLGIEEKPKGRFRALGIEDPAHVLKTLWDALNNPQRVNVNLLTDAKVERLTVEGKLVIKVVVPRARRSLRPIFIGANPFTGTYIRQHEGDYKCPEQIVKRMIAESVEDTLDSRILPKFNFGDLNMESFDVYRTQFKSTRPDHPWNDEEAIPFLDAIGGWGKDRDTGEDGLTLAGLLMFGNLKSILEVVPNYVVDYQERPEPRTESRWIDRLTTDGTWSGNLFDFYRRVIRKLTTELKVPFELSEFQRKDYTPIHEALREALVNSLIHADYGGQLSILVVKRPDMFGFRNPGNMRIPSEAAIRGGNSDCRNRHLQKMFQLVGLGEQAGSGIPKIYRNWNGQHWRAPLLHEKYDPYETLLELRMVSLLPPEVISRLRTMFHDRFDSLSNSQQLILATAEIEATVTHARIKEITNLHPHDLSKDFSYLVGEGFLESIGTGRGTSYCFPGTPRVVDGKIVGGPIKVLNSEHLAVDSEHLAVDSEHLKALAAFAAEKLEGKKKVPKEKMVDTILAVCAGKYLSLRELSDILNRSKDTLRLHYLNPLVTSGKMELLFPDQRNHPRQKYRTKTE